MKQKIKKIFENAVWWSGVIMVGLVLGLSLQFVRAWTEPTDVPPNGNVGAPINTGTIGQFKQGVLQVLGFTLYNNPDLNSDGIIDNDVTGKVLTAQNAYGAAAWAAGDSGGVGGCYISYAGKDCLVGFTNMGSAGKWGRSNCGHYCAQRFCPPGGTSDGPCDTILGEAYLCCQ
jgi:hypothetical protein